MALVLLQRLTLLQAAQLQRIEIAHATERAAEAFRQTFWRICFMATDLSIEDQRLNELLAILNRADEHIKLLLQPVTRYVLDPADTATCEAPAEQELADLVDNVSDAIELLHQVESLWRSVL